MSADKMMKEVQIKAGRAQLEGTLAVPDGASACIIFAHGSGSSHRSQRNRKVAQALNDAGFATLLFDLLTPEEEISDAKTGQLRFDITLLCHRLLAATAWIMQEPETCRHHLGYFGASTGAAAALAAAAELPRAIECIVSRGGRPDLAGAALSKVITPTLLIVGGRDQYVLDLNKLALNALSGKRELQIIPDASHLFEEPGALDMVAQKATAWFEAHLTPTQPEQASAAS